MPQENIIRAWKNENFRQQLSEQERALLPENPVGSIELTDEELGRTAGGLIPTKPPSWLCSHASNC
jgi:mersacidin/lichenicidin family type 2 lantibiotic